MTARCEIDMKQRALVAGATGYLGRHVVRELKQRDWWVRAIARRASRHDELCRELDDLVVGDVTIPTTIARSCDGIDRVFSSVGLKRTKTKLTFDDVDHRGNKNLLDIALAAGAKKFVYVSVYDGPRLEHLAIVKAHEDFVRALKASGIPCAVVRPTGYFSDMGEVFEMARAGRVFLFGKGQARMNPIHGADLACVCVDAMEGAEQEIDVGGPEVLSYREIAQAAFAALGTSPRISAIPAWVGRLSVRASKLIKTNSVEVTAFLSTIMMTDMVAPKHGSRLLRDHFAALVTDGDGRRRRT
jgi:uncharacterized protein YbjT (DUF2867 family)